MKYTFLLLLSVLFMSCGMDRKGIIIAVNHCARLGKMSIVKKDINGNHVVVICTKEVKND